METLFLKDQLLLCFCLRLWGLSNGKLHAIWSSQLEVSTNVRKLCLGCQTLWAWIGCQSCPTATEVCSFLSILGFDRDARIKYACDIVTASVCIPVVRALPQRFEDDWQYLLVNISFKFKIFFLLCSWAAVGIIWILNLSGWWQVPDERDGITIGR